MQSILLFGSPNSERRVSVASAKNLASAMPAGSEFWFWHPNGSVISCERHELLDFANPFATDFEPPQAAMFLSIEAAVRSLTGTGKIVFLCLHGKGTEDGVLQKILEAASVRYTGPNSKASYIAFNKLLCKELASRYGVKTAPGMFLPSVLENKENFLREIFLQYGPLVLKPLEDGSSGGLMFVHKVEEVASKAAAIEAAATDYLVEKLIKGRELTVGVMDRADGTTIPLVCTEVLLDSGRVFDFDGKYLAKGSLEVTPAQIPDDIAARVKAVALKVHRALDCRGCTRTDTIWGEDGEIYFLEINTLPGLTNMSFIPQQLAAIQFPFPEFVQEQILLAGNPPV